MPGCETLVNMTENSKTVVDTIQVPCNSFFIASIKLTSFYGQRG